MNNDDTTTIITTNPYRAADESGREFGTVAAMLLLPQCDGVEYVVIGDEAVPISYVEAGTLRDGTYGKVIIGTEAATFHVDRTDVIQVGLTY
jgi:hypothetical protein